MEYGVERQALVDAVTDRSDKFLQEHPVEQLAALLNTDIKKGLTTLDVPEELELRKQRYVRPTDQDDGWRDFGERRTDEGLIFVVISALCVIYDQIWNKYF